MFRIFLKKKILSGEDKDEVTKPTRSSYRRNRRIYERYNVTQQHLTILNDQDILVIREISPKGFSSDVSPRAFERFTKGDVFEGRIRYMGELYDFNIKVAWKRKKVVGFQILKASPEGHAFLNRLIKPVDISQSLKEVEPEEQAESSPIEGKKVWFQGEEGTDLIIWYNEADEVDAWRLSVDGEFVEWSQGEYKTGQVSDQEETTADKIIKVSDIKGNSQIQFGIDVIMTMESEHRQKLIAAIGEI